MFMLTIFALMSLVLGIPMSDGITARTSTCYNSKSADANFDDLTGVPGVLVPLPTPYMGLLFQGFGLLTVIKQNLAATVVPHSGTNIATSSSRTTTTGGSAEWTTNYAGSTVKTFTPRSFYYSCVLSGQNGAASPPIACNVAINGFAKGDNTAEAVQVAAQEFSYNPSTNTGVQQQVHGIFNAQFKDLQYVLIQYTLPGGLAGANPDLAFSIDDVVYSYCS